MTTRQARHRSGIRAEYLALAYLMLKGYRPVAQRYKTPLGEIDLILRSHREIIFVEVKARRDHASGAHAVHAKNQARVMRASQLFLQAHPVYASLQVRFDVCLIAWYKRPHHIKNAFQL